MSHLPAAEVVGQYFAEARQRALRAEKLRANLITRITQPGVAAPSPAQAQAAVDELIRAVRAADADRMAAADRADSPVYRAMGPSAWLAHTRFAAPHAQPTHDERPTPGALFAHARLFDTEIDPETGWPRPALCKVVRIRGGMVHYREGVTPKADSGVPRVSPLERFPGLVLCWLYLP